MVEHKRRLGDLMVAACLAGMPMVAAAQAGEPAPGSDTAALERAKRDADKVFKWILLHSDKPRKSAAAEPRPAAAPAAPPSAAPATATTTAAARPVARSRVEDGGIVERVTPLAASMPQPAAAAAAPLPQLSASDAALALATASAAAGRTAPPPGLPPGFESHDDEPLVVVKQVEPEFPASVMRRLGKGSVQVRFEVKPDGEVGEVEVLKTSSARLNEAATQAMAQWKFQPVKKAQHGVAELAFNLE